MDEELPPPFPGTFEHDLDNSRTHGEDEEHEVFGHIPLPEIEHSYVPDPGQPLKSTISSKNGMIPTNFPERFEDPSCSSEVTKEPKTVVEITSPTISDITNVEDVPSEQMLNGSKTPPLPVRPKQHVNIVEACIENIARSPEPLTNDDFEPGPNRSCPTDQGQRLEPDPPNAIVADNCDDEDDEFGDFAKTVPESMDSSVATPLDNAASVHSQPRPQEEEFEWGDFDKVARRDSHLASAPSVDEDDDFGAFGSAAPADEPAAFESESWTPQFTESPRDTDNETWEKSLLQEIVDVEWECEDTEDVDFKENNVSEISSVLNAANNSIGDDCPLKQAFELWCLLRIVEEAKSLQYVFEASTLASNHYKKINIDKSLTSKGVLSPLSSEVVLIPTPVNGNIVPSTTAEVLRPTATTSEEKCSPPSTSVPFDSLSAPPAEFDWDKSGLTNPLKGAKGSSALLDVDFLSANSGGSSSGTFTLQKDLEAFGLDMGVNISTKTPERSILDTLLSSASPQCSYKPVAELSLDARALHDQLPDLSCLLSRKVMLPFGGQNL